jgi:hypothetical protein
MVPSDLISSWLTTGMHGIEHCRQKRRTIRRSAPRWPFSPAPGSMLPSSPLAASCPEPVARNGFLLVRNSCRLSATSIPGSSSQPATSLPSKYAGCARSALRLHHRVPVCAGCGRFNACGPLHFHDSVQPAAPSDLHSPPGLLRPSGSKHQPRLLPAGPPDESARFPLAPRRPS